MNDENVATTDREAGREQKRKRMCVCELRAEARVCRVCVCVRLGDDATVIGDSVAGRPKMAEDESGR